MSYFTQEYLRQQPDVRTWIDVARQPGDAGAQNAFTQQFGQPLVNRDTTGWEQDWIRKGNQQFGTNYTDFGQFGPEQAVEEHYKYWGSPEGRQLATIPGKEYLNDPTYKALAERDQSVIDKQQFQQQYGGMGAAALSDFQTLLKSLEDSKIRQQQAKDLSARPSTYAEGLANMMRNF